MADHYFAQSRYPEAQEEFYRVLEVDPLSATCNAGVGMCWRERGQPRRGLPWMLRAARLDPAHGAYDAIPGETYMLVGEDQAAEAALHRSLLFDPDQPSALSSLAVLYPWKGQWEEASQMSGELSRRFPDFEYQKELAAEVSLFSGAFADALTCYEELASQGAYRNDWEYFGAINPASAVACLWLDKGEAAQVPAMLDQAIFLDEQLLAQHLNNARLLHDLAAAWTLKDEPATALRFLSAAVANGWVETRSTLVDPRFRRLRADAKFQELVGQATLPRRLGTSQMTR